MTPTLRTVVCMGLVAALVGTALADSTSPANQTQTEQDRITVLQAIADAQEARLGELNAQLAAAGQDAEAARQAAMKEQIREVLSEQEFRESLTPTMLNTGYDKGFYIKSSDDKFSMKFQWIMQFRWAHYGVNTKNRYTNPGTDRDDRTGFDVNRARFRVFGHAFDPNLTYFMSLTHAANTRYDVRSIYAWIDYRFCDAFHVRFGQMRMNGTRAQTSRITRYQFTELPFTDAVFGAGVSVGASFWGNLFDNRLTYYLDIVNSYGGAGATITNDPATLDSSPAVLFRVVWHALGENPGKEFPNQSDLTFHESPALDIGFHYAFNNDESDARTARIPFAIPNRQAGQGGFGLTNGNGMVYHTFGYEAAFQYRGFSAISEFHLRLLDIKRANSRPFSPYYMLTREGDHQTYYGGYLQAGYMLPIPGFENKFEIVGRVEGLGGVDPGDEGVWMYTAGLNYFIDGDRIKLQTDISKVSEAPISSGVYSLANVNDSALIWRVQLGFQF